jgi:hypothetical protein
MSTLASCIHSIRRVYVLEASRGTHHCSCGDKVWIVAYELWQLGEDGFIKESQGNFPTEEYNRQLKSGINSQLRTAAKKVLPQ